MFEIMDMMLFRKEIEIDGVKWLSLKYLQDGYHLVIKPTDSLPCQVWLVKEGKNGQR